MSEPEADSSQELATPYRLASCFSILVRRQTAACGRRAKEAPKSCVATPDVCIYERLPSPAARRGIEPRLRLRVSSARTIEAPECHAVYNTVRNLMSLSCKHATKNWPHISRRSTGNNRRKPRRLLFAEPRCNQTNGVDQDALVQLAGVDVPSNVCGVHHQGNFEEPHVRLPIVDLHWCQVDEFRWVTVHVHHRQPTQGHVLLASPHHLHGNRCNSCPW